MTDPKWGLRAEEVAARVAAGQSNVPYTAPGKTKGQIYRDNIFTLFNLLNVALASLVLVAAFRDPHYFVNLTFMGVILSNALIGIVQELRAKKTVDRLALLTAPTIDILREGREETHDVADLVVDDIMVLHSGKQIPVDGLFLEGVDFEVDESLLTGESDPVAKKPGEKVFSGSVVVSGQALVLVTHVSDQTYAAEISRQVKKVRRNNSEIVLSLKKIIRSLTMAIVPVGLLLFFSKAFALKVFAVDISFLLTSTVAALVGMIPEGLMLMTSIAFAVGVIRLGSHQTLVQSLPSIEALARVDLLCADKTGTITSGEMEVLQVYGLRLGDEVEAHEARLPEAVQSLLRAQTEKNATQHALDRYLDQEGYPPEPLLPLRQLLPFNSKRKYSGADFGQFSLRLGAAEFVLGQDHPAYPKLQTFIEQESRLGHRLLLAATSSRGGDPSTLEKEAFAPLVFLSLGDQIREDAAETFAYFKAQGVGVKVISGDHPLTVAAVARRAGILPDTELELGKTIVDVSLLEEKDLPKAAQEGRIFGRVTPERKRDLLRALQKAGHIVAMTGDGVNDVPALKEADCAVAMASGSDAARAAADLVLLENGLRGMIASVYEGRRVINNIERVATLFLVKTIYSFLLALSFIFIPLPFPILPIQITLVSSLAIGFPAFILALKPNRERVEGHFLSKVLFRCVPIALATSFMVLLVMLLSVALQAKPFERSAFASLTLAVGGLINLYRVCQPWDRVKRLLFASCIVALIGAAVFFPRLFFLQAIWTVKTLPFLLLLLLYFPLIRGIEALSQQNWVKTLKQKLNRHLQVKDRLRERRQNRKEGKK